MLVIALSILWIAAIISFFYATPFTEYIFSNRFASFFSSLNLFLLISIPLFSVLMFLINKTFKKTVASNLHLRAGLGSLWAVNLVSLLFFGISESRNFNMGTSISERVNLPYFESDTIYINKIRKSDHINSMMSFGPLKLDDKGLVNHHIHYRFVKSDSDELEITQINHSRGRTSAEAERHAQAINYEVKISENEINLPRTFPILKGSKYRGQEVEIVFKVPVGKTVKFGRGISNSIHEFEDDRDAGNPWRNDGKYFWTMGENGFVAHEYVKKRNQQQSYNSFKDFTQIQIDGEIILNIEQSNNFDIKSKNAGELLEEIKVNQIGDILTITLTEDPDRYRDSEPELTIKMPELLSYDGNGTEEVTISGFEQKNMLLKSDGAHELKALVNVDSLVVRQEGRTRFDLRGEGQYLKVVMDGGSRLDADRYKVSIAELKMTHNNSVALSVTDTLYRRGESTRHAHGLNLEGEPAVVDLGMKKETDSE
ncbi:MAG: hypothetical protein ACI8YQ_000401 [Polaribacter sp.]